MFQRAVPILALDHCRILNTSAFKFPININLMTEKFAGECFVMLDLNIPSFVLIYESLEDSARYLFVLDTLTHKSSVLHHHHYLVFHYLSIKLMKLLADCFKLKINARQETAFGAPGSDKAANGGTSTGGV